jgi:hypothetical protein
MAKKTLVNTETSKSVADYLAGVTHKTRKADAETMLNLMSEISGKEAKIWGQSIIAFGKYSYQRKNGDEFEWFNVGFSPAKAHLSLYLMFDLEKEELLNDLGPHKKGRGCLYIKKLADVDLEIVKQLITKSIRVSEERSSS